MQPVDPKLNITLEPQDRGKKGLHLIHPRSDAAMFYDYEILFLAQVDSHSQYLDRQKMLAQAAFYLRFLSLTLNLNTFCLPIFFITKNWEGECLLVYKQETEVSMLILTPDKRLNYF